LHANDGASLAHVQLLLSLVHERQHGRRRHQQPLLLVLIVHKKTGVPEGLLQQ
jgi:hypothetical protein